MAEAYEVQRGEDIIADLVRPANYLAHRNQVAAVTNQRIWMLKRNLIGEPYTFEDYPIQECSRISYRKSFAIAGMFGGAVMLLIGLAVIYYGITGRLPGLGVITSLPFLLGTGAALVLGVRRHRLTFFLGQKTLVWKSGPGEFKDRLAPIADIEAFAREKGIATTIPEKLRQAKDQDWSPY